MNDRKAEHPFYFMVPFWGQRYREYFVDLCLPSLLAPNNIPLLRAEDGHCLLMATTREDWEAIEHLPIMDRLRQHVTLTCIEVSNPTPTNSEVHAQYASAIQHQNLCQKKLVAVAYNARAYGCMLCPDFIHSDGMIAALLKHAEAGVHLVLCPALRQTEEAVLGDLLKHGLLSKGDRLSLTGQALTISPRAMAGLFVRHLHPEMWGFEERDVPIPPPRAPFRYWRVPDDRGIILHTFFGIPVLMDYGIVPVNHAECLDRDILENVYYSENFASGNIHIVQDSDEFGIVSLTPAAVSQASQAETPRFRWLQKYDRLCNIRESMWFFAGRGRDVLRRDLFRLPIRLHATDLDEVWEKEERRIDRLIHITVGDYYSVSRPPNPRRFPAKFSFNPRVLLMDVPSRLHEAISMLKRHLTLVMWIVGKRVGLALCGDKVALRWWGWRLCKFGAKLVGRSFQEPKPPTPE